MGTALLACGFVEIQYTTVMHSIFKRPPSLASDWSLLRSGVKLAQRQAYWMIPLATAVLALVVVAAAKATAALLAALPEQRWPLAAVALLLLVPCFYHAAVFYAEYLSRTVYSPLLHFALNIRASARVKTLYQRDAAHYERHNLYRGVTLQGSPSIVVICIESYGSIVHRDEQLRQSVSPLLDAHQAKLQERGYRVASTFSDAPLFAGGSWLSYASFIYGAPINDVQLYDGLFTRPNEFGVYESLFHVLRRNGYENALLCPLGGVDSHAVDWASVDRCFQCHRRFAFEDLSYVGPRVNFLGSIRRYSPLDQFSLNFGYEQTRAASDRFALFFCTLNSHYPWHTVTQVADDWRDLNRPAAKPAAEGTRTLGERYGEAIRYQLDYILRFATERADDAPLIILFGDHQPPIITPEVMGKQTPVHVLSRDGAVIDEFLAHGFVDTLNLSGLEPQAIRHEGFLSLLMRALHGAYGADHDLELPYRERGAMMFEDDAASVLR
jgi:hypothetical protein